VSASDPTREGRQALPGWAPPAILVGVVLLFATIATIPVLGAGGEVRPEAGMVPLPEGATVRFMDERCPSPEALQPDDGRTHCDIVLAVGPLEGLWIPGATESLITEHLEAEGWSHETDPIDVDAPVVLVAPDGTMTVRIEALDETDERDPALGDEIRDRVRDFVDPDELAVLTAYPRR
jgi:hypothetical protein